MAHSETHSMGHKALAKKARKDSIKVISKYGNMSKKQAAKRYEEIREGIAIQYNGLPVKYMDIRYDPMTDKVVIYSAAHD